MLDGNFIAEIFITIGEFGWKLDVITLSSAVMFAGNQNYSSFVTSKVKFKLHTSKMTMWSMKFINLKIFHKKYENWCDVIKNLSCNCYLGFEMLRIVQHDK